MFSLFFCVTSISVFEINSLYNVTFSALQLTHEGCYFGFSHFISNPLFYFYFIFTFSYCPSHVNQLLPYLWNLPLVKLQSFNETVDLITPVLSEEIKRELNILGLLCYSLFSKCQFLLRFLAPHYKPHTENL